MITRFAIRHSTILRPNGNRKFNQTALAIKSGRKRWRLLNGEARTLVISRAGTSVLGLHQVYGTDGRLFMQKPMLASSATPERMRQNFSTACIMRRSPWH